MKIIRMHIQNTDKKITYQIIVMKIDIEL